ncbi:FTR1 family iron permease [Acidihalobacter ferrooxydans]|uniref:Iron permease n=1 Tax=Acidihalobacter ferrooxydans TaxID=1765967 RepID=A0A1P8UJY6_9GAMM|nr:FTR1 family protein [Acidihalobacter ferrooxydans]APZ44150.1 iron permease [Acidihalobacter ferrooxydans]
MLGSAVIVFREVLEAALIISIVMGATRGVAARGRWVLGGVAAGVAGAILVAASAGAISDAVQGRGQELLNAGVLLTAVLMLAWHNIWMSSHGRELAGKMREVGHDVGMGVKPLSALALVAFLAVLREGSETALFLYSLSASGAGSMALLFGGVLGLAGGAALGMVVYRGMLAIPLRHFFSVTGWLVLLLAAGLAANAAGFLNQAGLVPSLVPQVWDSSAWLSQTSWTGTLLHILVGYNDRPMGIQVLFYLVTLSVIYLAMRVVGRSQRRVAAAT